LSDLTIGTVDPKRVTLNCPNCGAATSPDSTRCAYCLSSLTSLICSKCFGAIFLGMKHCPWCGQESGSAQPETTGGLKCPRCAEPLAQIQANEHTLSKCLKCGGLWVDAATLREICTTAEDQEAVLAMDQRALPAASAAHRPRRAYIPCPLCAKLMNRTNFAGCSGVIIDWCKPHGSWFDKDELRRIVEFVRNGGLKRSREREKEQLEQERGRLREQQRYIAQLSRPDSSAPAQWDSGIERFFEAVSRVLGESSPP
jgi:Zn-finger nucleic acid-binding protein